MDQDLARTSIAVQRAMINNDKRTELNLNEATDIFDEKRFLGMWVEKEEYRVQGDLLKVSARGEDYQKGYEIRVLTPISLLRLEKQIEAIKEEKEEGI